MLQVQTKKFQLPIKTYLRVSMINILKEQWWVALIALGFIVLSIPFPRYSLWFIIVGVVGFILYLLFWLVQFYGVTQLQQTKIFFERLYYIVENRQIAIMLNQKEGMPVQWDQIKKAEKRNDAFVLILSKAQMIYLPFSIFKSKNDINWTEAMFKKKGKIK